MSAVLHRRVTDPELNDLALDILTTQQGQIGIKEQYLRLMVRHHEGAVPMAAYAAEHATSPDVVRLARAMEQGQVAEIDVMQGMLVARGLAPEAGGDEGPAPAPAASSHNGHG